MDIDSLEKLVSSGKSIKPINIFSGPEFFLKERMFQKMVDQFVPVEDQSENVCRIDCSSKDSNCSGDQIFNFSFNPSPRFFLFQNFNGLTAALRKSFISIISQNGIPTGTFLVFTTSDAKVAGELSSAFKQQSEKTDFWQPFENRLPAWVKKEATELGGKISPDAVELLIELTGSNLSIIFQELTKLVISSSGKLIDAKLVKSSVSYQKQNTVFDFLDNFGNKRIKAALRSIEILLNTGEAPQKIWFLLNRQLREFRLLHELILDRPDLFSEIASLLFQYAKIVRKSDFKSNQEKKSIVSQIQTISETMPPMLPISLGLNSTAKVKNLYMAMNFRYSDLIRFWPAIMATDLKLKSGVPDAKAALQKFVAEFLTASTA